MTTTFRSHKATETRAFAVQGEPLERLLSYLRQHCPVWGRHPERLSEKVRRALERPREGVRGLEVSAEVAEGERDDASLEALALLSEEALRGPWPPTPRATCCW